MNKSTVTMKINILNLVLILLVTVTKFHAAFGKTCKRGEPNPLEVEPDLNITISPLAGQVGEQLQITCDAGLPRFPLPPFTRPLPATTIVISHDGKPGNELEKCQDGNGITQCIFNLTLAEDTTKLVICQAKNSDGQCRVKVQKFDILKKSVSSTRNLQMIDSSSSPTLSPSVNLRTVESSSFPIVSPSVKQQKIDSSSLQMSSTADLQTSKSLNLQLSSTADLQTSKSLNLQSTRYVNATPSVPDSKVSSTADLQTSKSLNLQSSTPSVETSSTPSLPNGGSSKEIPEVVNSSVPSIMVPSSPLQAMTSSVAISSTSSLPNGGLPKKISEDDDEELDTVKSLVIATLVLVSVMIVLLLVALFYIIRIFKN